MPEIELIVFSGPDGEIARHTFGPGAYTIGRATACDVTIKVGPVSRQHARIVVGENGGVQVEDLASANGTLLDGQTVGGLRPWRPGQILDIGEVTLQLRGGDPEFATSLNPAESAISPTLETTPLANDADDLLRRNLPLQTREAQIYAIGAEVARGGMGAVLQARESATRRTVAMKVMLRGGDARSTLRFIEEAQVTAQLEHPNVVPVHDLGIDEQGRPFYTMKMVAGITLKKVLELLKQGVPATVEKFPLGTLLTDFQKVCDALAFAHSRGVIHRDLKPANIMLGKFGEVLVMDWGLAKIVGTKSALRDEATAGASEVTVVGARREQSEVFSTMDGAIMGTPHYMSPEQAAGEIETLEARSDLFALGIILYEILTLERPFTGRTAAEIVAKVSEGDFIPPAQRATKSGREVAPRVPKHPGEAGDPAMPAIKGARGPASLPHLPGGRVPESLDAIVRKAMAHDPAARYPSVPALQADLTAYQNGFATGAERASAWKQLKLLIKRNKAASIGAAAVLLVGSIFGTGAIIQGRRATTALADLKKTAPAFRQLAEREAGFGFFDSALQKLDAARALDPDDLPSQWRRAWLLIGMEDYASAATAIRAVQTKDPTHREWASILPVVEQLAAVPEGERWTPERRQGMYDYLQKVGAVGEVLALSTKLTLGTEEIVKRIRNSLGKSLGNDNFVIDVTDAGLIEVSHLGAMIRDFTPLHRLPINRLNIRGSSGTDLEPLRHMPLTWLDISHTKVTNIESLRGMRLRTIFANDTKTVTDWSPLQKMPLEEFFAYSTQIKDLTFLAGAPLRKLDVGSCNIADISGLRGTTLREVALHGNHILTLDALRDAPIENLSVSDNLIADLTPLRGKPLQFLKILHINRTKVSDLSPLKDAPIVELQIARCPITDFRPLLDLPKLEKLRISYDQRGLEVLRYHPSLSFIAWNTDYSATYLPVAEFWKQYDEQQKAGAK